MHAIKLNHWYLKDNELSISLRMYYVKIKMILDNNRILAKLKVINSNREELDFLFDSIESAVSYTENIINKGYGVTFDDMKDAYNKDASGKVFKKRREF